MLMCLKAVCIFTTLTFYPCVFTSLVSLPTINAYPTSYIHSYIAHSPPVATSLRLRIARITPFRYFLWLLLQTFLLWLWTTEIWTLEFPMLYECVRLILLCESSFCNNTMFKGEILWLLLSGVLKLVKDWVLGFDFFLVFEYWNARIINTIPVSETIHVLFFRCHECVLY